MRRLAAELELTPRDAALVVDAGLAGECYETETATYVSRAAADALVAREPLGGPHPSILQVRIRPAAPAVNDDTREFMGWHADLDQAAQRAGVDRWWRVRDPERLVESEAWLVATLASFIVHVGQIKAFTRGPGSLVRFDLLNIPEAPALLNARLRGPRGGNTVLVPDAPA